MANHYIHPSAVVIGNVTLGKRVSIWPLAVLRADMGKITVGDGTNIQDGCVLHVDAGNPLVIGRDVTIGHKAVLHGCQVGDNSLIGIGAIVLDGARIGENCMIAAGSLVSSGKNIPPNSLVMGTPGRVIRTLTDSEIEKLRQSAQTYWQLAQRQMEKD